MDLPAPVAPTSATVRPGGTWNETPFRISSPFLYEKRTSSNATSPRRGPGGATGSAGAVIAGCASRSWKIRSEEAIAACRMLYFSERSMSGR